MVIFKMLKKLDLSKLFATLGVLSLLVWIAGLLLHFEQIMTVSAAVSMISFFTLSLDFYIVNFKINDTLDEDFLINGTTKIFKDYFQYNDKKIKFDEIETFNIATVKSDSRGTYLEIVLKLTNGEYLHDDDKLYETISGSDEKLKWRFLYLYLYDLIDEKISKCGTISEEKNMFIYIFIFIHAILHTLFLYDYTFLYLFLAEIFINLLISFNILSHYEDIEKCYKYKTILRRLQNIS